MWDFLLSLFGGRKRKTPKRRKTVQRGGGSPPPPKVQPIKKVPADIVGLNIGNQAGDTRIIPAAADTGIGWIRLVADWGRIEASPGVYDWDHNLARDMISANLAGLKTFVTVFNLPEWATYRDAMIFRRFVTAMLDQFPEIRAVGVWNEPNHSDFWGGSRDEYFNFVYMASSAVRSRGTILAAGSIEQTTRPHEYARALEAEVGDFYDVLEVHFYGPAADLRTYLQGFPRQKPIWVGETALGPDQSPLGQAKQLAEVLLLEEWDKVFFYHWYADRCYPIRTKPAEAELRRALGGGR